MFKRATAAVFVALIASAAPVFTDAGDRAAAVQTASTPATPEEEQAIKLRQDFGLSADLDHVRDVAASAQADMNALGIPLTLPEAANILARDALTAVVGKIDAGAALLPGYADVWTDQAAGGVVHVGLVGGAAATAAPIIRLLAAPLPIVIDDVKHSLAALAATRRSLSARTVSDDVFRSQLVQIALRPQINAVTVELLSGTPQSVVDALQESYGDQLRIGFQEGRFETQSRSVNSGRLYGGQWTGGCTVGYSYISGGGKQFMATAGHCTGVGNGLFYRGDDGQKDAKYIGATYANSYSPGGQSYCDCRIVGPIDASLATNKVLVAAADPPYQYTRTGTASNYKSGEKACVSGAFYADTHKGNIICGTIVGGGDTPTATGFLLLDAVYTNIGATRKGDSGAPYGNGGSFLGIHSALREDGQESAFSKAKYLNGMGNGGKYGAVFLDY